MVIANQIASRVSSLKIFFPFFVLNCKPLEFLLLLTYFRFNLTVVSIGRYITIKGCILSDAI